MPLFRVPWCPAVADMFMVTTVTGTVVLNIRFI